MTDADSGERAPERGLGERAVRGAIWAIGARLSARAVDFATLLLLAHLLSPADFGLVAIAMTLITLIEAVLELPLHTAIFRLDDIRPAHYDTAFTLGVLRGLVVTVATTLIAFPFSKVYHDDRLFMLICALGVAPAARSLSSPRIALITKELKASPLFTIEVGGKVAASILACTFALTTHSYWAIAIGTITAPVVMSLLTYLFAPYRPRLSLAEWPSFSGFLGWSSAGQFLAALNWQADRLILGRLISRPELGRYSIAGDLSSLPSQAIVKPVIGIFTPTLTNLQRDRDRIASAYLKCASTLSYIALPIAVGSSFVATPLIAVLLGPKWVEAADILRVVSLLTIPFIIIAPYTGLYLAMGETRLFFRQNLIELTTKIPMMLGGALVYGIWGVIAAVAASTVIQTVVITRSVRTLTGLTPLAQLMAGWRACASALAMIAAIALINLIPAKATLMPALSLFVDVATGAAVYVLAVVGLWLGTGRPDGIERDALGLARRILRLA